MIPHTYKHRSVHLNQAQKFLYFYSLFPCGIYAVLWALFANGGEWNLVCGAQSLNTVILNTTETYIFRNNVQNPQDNPQTSLSMAFIRTSELSTK